jgi:23S rRNA (cytosine1962-C5)-methyltransferase
MSSSPADLPAEDRAPRLRLRVSRVAETHIRSGHPWVFSDSVRDANRPGEDGELAVIYDRNNRFLALGLFDPNSPIRVRILHQGKPCTIDDAWFQQNLNRSLGARQGMFGPETTGYRLINGESDGWPALVLDRYDTTYVLKLYSLAWLQRLELLQSLLVKALAPERIVLRLSRNIQERAQSQFQRTDGEVLCGAPLETTSDAGTSSGSGDSLSPWSDRRQSAPSPCFMESGIWFEADVVRGQKTGFFLDQRENRRRIGGLAANRRVLNAFSFSGGFSLYAARGGARSVTDLDISSHALESARRNVALNANTPTIAACTHECIRDDVFERLNRKPDREFDLIILDPPSLARREAERAGAIAAYSRLASDAIRWLAAGGILFAASCSAHVSSEEFLDAVRSAASGSGRRFAELATTGHAPDHPATFPEAQYLKGIYLEF